MAINPTGRPSVSDYLMRGVLDLTRSQRLRPGDRLPSVQALAQRFSVAAPTMRESLRGLEAVGLLEIRHGSGVYLKRQTHHIVLPNPHPGQLSRATILDLLDARLLIEPQLAGLAAQRVTRPELDDLAATLARAATHLASEERVLGRLNMDFHRKIAALSGTIVLSQVIFSLLGVYEDEQLVVQRLYNDRARDHREHMTILEAVAAHDSELARSRMDTHLRGVRDILAARLPGEEANAGSSRHDGAGAGS